mgnify:CR=1 FL=1
MRITQWGEYGIHCAAYIAAQEKLGAVSVSAQDISDSQMIDIQYAQQILQRLRKNNIVKSIRGPHGGYKLSRPASDISLCDLLQAAEGDTFELICEQRPINSTRCTPDSACSLRPVWQKLKTHINGFLQSVKLEELLNDSLGHETPVKISRHSQSGL